MHVGWFSGLGRGLRWQDAADVLVLTFLFSRAYLLLRRTVAIQIAFVLVTLLATSWVASHLGLILTSYLLSTVSAVGAIVIVVVFQHEIRRGLGRVSPLRWLTVRQVDKVTDDVPVMVAEAAFALAARGKGALMVLARRDWLGEQITAGIPIDSRLSSPLLQAIFTASSSLHDGAVLIKGGRLVLAGVILPLAADTGNPEHGTRHRAAAGLARLSDAVVVCVSEEQGTVCLAHDQQIDELRDANQLRGVLDQMGLGRRPEVAQPRRGAARLGGLPAHLAIFAGVLVAWGAVALDRSHAVGRVVPLEIRGVSDRWLFDPPRYNSVAIELRGSQRELSLIEPDAVSAFVDLSGASAGPRVFRVQTTAPAGIEVVSTTPSTVLLLIRPRSPPAPTPGPLGSGAAQERARPSRVADTGARPHH
jgi:diadenylate cyclase